MLPPGKEGPARKPRGSSALPRPHRALLSLASHKPRPRHAHHPCHAHATSIPYASRPRLSHHPPRPRHAHALLLAPSHAHAHTLCVTPACASRPYHTHTLASRPHLATPTTLPRPPPCHAPTSLRPQSHAPTLPRHRAPRLSVRLPLHPPSGSCLHPTLVHPTLSLDRGSSPLLVGVPPSAVARLWGEAAGLSFISCYK